MVSGYYGKVKKKKEVKIRVGWGKKGLLFYKYLFFLNRYAFNLFYFISWNLVSEVAYKKNKEKMMLLSVFFKKACFGQVFS